MVLYGSAVRGEAREGSDIDVLVIAEEHCSPGLPAPFTVLVNTVEEWLSAPPSFRAEVLRDGVLLYASGLGVRELTGMRPWALITYGAADERSRQCVKIVVKKILKNTPSERPAPGVLLAPYGAVHQDAIHSIMTCGGRAQASIVLYKDTPVWRATCPYCGHTVAGNEKHVKRELKNHLLALHHPQLRERAEELQRQGKGVPGKTLKGLAGYLAALLITRE